MIDNKPLQPVDVERLTRLALAGDVAARAVLEAHIRRGGSTAAVRQPQVCVMCNYADLGFFTRGHVVTRMDAVTKHCPRCDRIEAHITYTVKW